MPDTESFKLLMAGQFRAAAESAPYLGADEEAALVRDFVERGDDAAARRIVISHLRLVLSVARSYLGYGMAMEDLIQEGCAGMMEALRRFEPGKGFRVSTYAQWWIRAAVQDFILRNYSSVKLAASKEQRKLFFRMRWARAAAGALDQPLTQEQACAVAANTGASLQDVLAIDARMGPDISLNAAMHDEGGPEWIDEIPDARPGAEQILCYDTDWNWRMSLVKAAFEGLTEREREILKSRRLAETAETLESLGLRYGVSGTRISQIENKAFRKLRQTVLDLAGRAAA